MITQTKSFMILFNENTLICFYFGKKKKIMKSIFLLVFQFRMEFQLVIVALLAIIATSMMNVSGNIVPNTPQLCEPGVLEEMPPHIKKVCTALENSNQLSTALNAYIRNEAAGRIKNQF